MGKTDGTGSSKFDILTPDDNIHTGVRTQTGQNEADKVCNIYDLEGNCFEYVAEKCFQDLNNSFVIRGGNYEYKYAASFRNNGNGNALYSTSFRFVLYVI